MSANKYANLPDIDLAPDVYETEDPLPTRSGKGDSEEEEAVPTRPSVNGLRGGKHADNTREELDASNLMDTREAAKKFRKAEKRREKPRLIYVYPSSSPPSPTSPTQPHSLGTRLRQLQAELDALEAELSDPLNPALQMEDGKGLKGDPGELMRGVVEVRGRLEKVRKGKESRGKLVETILNREDREPSHPSKGNGAKDAHDNESKDEDSTALAGLDRRIGELEELIGSSSVALDETSPLPAPLLPMLTKLNTQLALLTQPRHLDSISRRLKLLISDLDRLSSANAQAGSSRRQAQHAHTGSGTIAPTAPSPLQEQLLPLLARLAPHLPHLPHLLTRLRTLSTLHASAADFQGSLGALEEEQRRVRGRLSVLTEAVESVEKSLEENASVVKANVGGLGERVNTLMSRLDALSA